MTKHTGLLFGMALTILAASSAHAAPVFVANPSFESPFVATFNTGPVTGWNVGLTGGVLRPTFGGYLVAPDGSQIGYSGDGNGIPGSNYGILYQNVGSVVANATYSLTVDVVQSLHSPGNDWRILMGWGGHDLATTNVFASISNAPVLPGTFAPITLVGTAPAGASGPLLIFLENSGAFGVATQTGWDAVSLFSNVPEPAAWAMMLVGFGGLGAAMRLARRKTAMSLATA